MAPAVHGAAGATRATTPAAAEAEIKRVHPDAYSNPKHPYNDKGHPEHEALHTRLSELYRMAEQARS